MIMLAILPLYACIYTLYNHFNKRMERKVMEDTASLEDHFVETLQASTYIRQHNLYEQIRLRTEQRLNHLLDSVYRSGIGSISAGGITEAVNRLFTVILLWTGTLFIIRGSMTPGNLLTFYALMGYLTGPLNGLIGANRIFQNAMIAADRLFEIFQLEPEEPAGKQEFRHEQFGDVMLRGVSFSYGTRGRVIEDLNLTIQAGSITAITGASGSGKSTVAHLIQHLYPLEKGRITIGGCDTRYYSVQSIRSLIGVVPQRICFLSGTILENLAPGVREPDLGRVTFLLKEVGMQTLIESLPGGLHTVLTKNASNLSGGERQRLAIVRALYRDPALLILDEATSSLDPVSEIHLNRILLSLREQSKTVLIISHKVQFASLADRIFLMDQGRIRETGKGTFHASRIHQEEVPGQISGHFK